MWSDKERRDLRSPVVTLALLPKPDTRTPERKVVDLIRAETDRRLAIFRRAMGWT